MQSYPWNQKKKKWAGGKKEEREGRKEKRKEKKKKRKEIEKNLVKSHFPLINLHKFSHVILVAITEVVMPRSECLAQ